MSYQRVLSGCIQGICFSMFAFFNGLMIHVVGEIADRFRSIFFLAKGAVVAQQGTCLRPYTIIWSL